jgi:DNA-binding transcriptional LysR family regulator
MELTRSLTMFLAVATKLSFRKAAIDEGVSPQAVSKSVKHLEKNLGVKLLHRTTRHLSLTEEGERLYQNANPGMQLLNDALDELQENKRGMSGRIRLAAPLAFGNRVLVPLMHEFQLSYPDVHFDLMLSDAFVDTISQRIDIGFRTGLSPERNVISRKLGDIVSVICAAPCYLEKYGIPSNIEDIQNHRCTGFLHPQTGKEMPWEIQVDGELTYVHVPAIARFNNIEAEIDAVKLGLGIGQLSEYLVKQELDTGALIRLVPEGTTARLGIYMYYTERTQIPFRIRQFIDYCHNKFLNK